MKRKTTAKEIIKNEIKQILKRNNILFEDIKINKNEICVITGQIAIGEKWEEIETLFYIIFQDGLYYDTDIHLQGEQL